MELKWRTTIMTSFLKPACAAKVLVILGAVILAGCVSPSGNLTTSRPETPQAVPGAPTWLLLGATDWDYTLAGGSAMFGTVVPGDEVGDVRFELPEGTLMVRANATWTCPGPQVCEASLWYRNINSPYVSGPSPLTLDWEDPPEDEHSAIVQQANDPGVTALPKGRLEVWALVAPS